MLLLLPAALLLAACSGLPEGGLPVGNEHPPGFFPVAPATEQGERINSLYPVVFWIAVAVFVLVEGILLWIAFRYRRRRNADPDQLPAQTHGSNLLEIAWTAIPAIIVTYLFVATLDTLAFVENIEPEPQGVIIDVEGFQWQWTFRYPNEGLSFTGVGREGPAMGIPINESVRIRLHAQDVIHSFYVPQFLYKKDAVPGRVNEFDITLRQPGTYRGQCAEFCGLAHTDMYFTVLALERADYDVWVEESREQPDEETPPPDAHVIEVSTPDVNNFDPPDLTAPADTTIVFELSNTDPSSPHNIAIVGAMEDGSDWIGLPLADAGQTATYTAPALAAGEYEFFCSVHPTTMRGTLTVGN
ncbi:MAG TPA: cytochrome c oxidase subunit II [Candidatus Limnocylindria bacterium]|nr:cytochrome c oxidase subunit II [Candidatus Limnocylindria bacterium]